MRYSESRVTRRSEHWIVVEGKAKVTVGDEVRFISEGESVFVPLGAIHRLENPGELPMILIEVQTGSYFGEDDIIRYEDAFEDKKYKNKKNFTYKFYFLVETFFRDKNSACIRCKE